MTAVLAYQIIQTLSESERDLLLDMIRPEMKTFKLEELISEEQQEVIERNEMIEYLLRTQFRKIRKSKHS